MERNGTEWNRIELKFFLLVVQQISNRKSRSSKDKSLKETKLQKKEANKETTYIPVVPLV